MRREVEEHKGHYCQKGTELESPMPSTALTLCSLREGRALQYDRDQTRTCHQICSEVLCRVNEAQLQLLLDRSPSMRGGLDQAHVMTSLALQECGSKLNQTLSRLYGQLENVGNESSIASSLPQALRTQIGSETQRPFGQLYHTKPSFTI